MAPLYARVWRLCGLLAISAVLSAVGCAGGDSEDAEPDERHQRLSTAIADRGFQPDLLFARAGDTYVTLVVENRAEDAHELRLAVSGDDEPTADLGRVGPGETSEFELPFTLPGPSEFDLYCDIHPEVRARLFGVPPYLDLSDR
jgi:plastocyanin